MALKVVTHVEDGLGTVRKTIVAETSHDWTLLQELFQRAGNLWPDATPQVKRIVDLVTGGEVLQDYGPNVDSKGKPTAEYYDKSKQGKTL